MSEDINLESLVGQHEFSGIDFLQSADKTFYGDLTEIVNFVLDGVTYTATEDPSDGYRSYLDSLVISDYKPVNTFPPCVVNAVMNSDHEDNVILDFIDVTTGKIVFSLGTDYSDDYYPRFVANFDPTAMVVNN